MHDALNKQRFLLKHLTLQNSFDLQRDQFSTVQPGKLPVMRFSIYLNPIVDHLRFFLIHFKINAVQTRS